MSFFFFNLQLWRSLQLTATKTTEPNIIYSTEYNYIKVCCAWSVRNERLLRHLRLWCEVTGNFGPTKDQRIG